MLLAVVVLARSPPESARGRWREHGPQRPEISAYSHGHLTRVGPYRYCNVLNPTDCDTPKTEGELAVNSRDPVQLSVPPSIGRAPWWLLRVYEDSAIPATTFYRPDSRLAVTIPTVDPHAGRLSGIAVQLMTVVVDRAGEVQGYRTPNGRSGRCGINTLAANSVSNVVLRLLQTRRVRVVALVLQFMLLLTLVLGHLPGILGIQIGVAAGVLVHARSFSQP